MSGFSMVQGSLRPSRLFRLRENGKPIDLTRASSVEIVFKPCGGARREAAVAVMNAKEGVVRYDWQSGDTEAVGDYAYRFRITIDGRAQYVPDSGPGVFTVVPVL